MVFKEDDIKLLRIAINGQKEGETPRYSEEDLSNLDEGTASQHLEFKARKDVKKLKKRQKQLKKQATDYQNGPISRKEVNQHFLTKKEYGQAREGLLALINALVGMEVIKKEDIEKAFQTTRASEHPNCCEYCAKDKAECKKSGVLKKSAIPAAKLYPLVGNQTKLGKTIIKCEAFEMDPPEETPEGHQKQGGDGGGDSGKNKS